MRTGSAGAPFVLAFILVAASSSLGSPGESASALDRTRDIVISEKPLQDPLEVATEERFRIGAEALGRGSIMVIDQYAVSPADGNIYLFDARDFALHVFEPSGRHVGDVRIPKGQGPGELGGRFPLFNKAYPALEGIWAEDISELALFDGQGRFLRKKVKNPPESYDRILGATAATFLAIRQERAPGSPADPIRAVPKVQHLQMEDWDGRVLARYFSSGKTGGWGNAWTAAVEDERISPRIVFDYDPPTRRVVYASSDEYALTVADADGKVLRAFGRRFRPRAITAAMREIILASPYFREQVEIMKANGQDFMKMMDVNQSWGALNPILGVRFLGEGLIGVFVLTDAEGRFETDIFDREGRWRTTLRFPEPVRKLSHPWLRGNRLAGLETDEDGESTYVEYSLRNVPPRILKTPATCASIRWRMVTPPRASGRPGPGAPGL